MTAPQIGAMPLAAFDIETTGPAALSDRIVAAHLALIDPKTGATSGRNWMLHPGIAIPAEATAVHGITDADVEEHGIDYAQGLVEIAQALTDAQARGYLLVVFNAAFDLTMLHHETARAVDAAGYLYAGPIFDPMVVDKALDQWRPGKRKLEDQCRTYAVRLDAAHEAQGDSMAAARLAWRMMREFNLATMTTEQAMDCQKRWRAESQADFARHLVNLSKKVDDEVEAGRMRARAASITGEWPVMFPTQVRSAA